MYNRAAVYDSHNLNSAFVINEKHMLDSGGQAFTLASNLETQIKNLKNGGYTATTLQYDTWEEIPESLVLPILP